jgi:lipocalin
VLYWLLNRKPKLARDAERRMQEIREERGNPYNKLRPLR